MEPARIPVYNIITISQEAYLSHLSKSRITHDPRDGDSRALTVVVAVVATHLFAKRNRDEYEKKYTNIVTRTHSYKVQTCTSERL